MHSDYDPDAMPVEAARAYIRTQLEVPRATVLIPLSQALGRVLAAPVVASFSVPGYDHSAMDGYALNYDEVMLSGTSTLRLVGTALAGKPLVRKIQRGECAGVMTGAMIPSGCDTVVMQEHVTRVDDGIQIPQGLRRGQHVRYVGEDIMAGETVLACGQQLRPAELGLIASLGLSEVSVYCLPRVAVFSTGDELVEAGHALANGQIYDSNRYTLIAMLMRLGVEVIDLGSVPDEPAQLEATLMKASVEADVVLSSGGVSVGEADYMKQLLAQRGQVVFWKIAMKPGRPLAYGKIGRAHYFGLPGNPVAVMVTFYQFVREALLLLMGEVDPAPVPMLSAICAEAIKKSPGRTEFQRGVLFAGADGVCRVRPTGNQSSGVLRSMSLANCFIVLPMACGSVNAGERVNVQVLEGLI